MIGRFLALGKPLEGGSVNQENIEPAIVVVVEQRDPAADRFKNISLLALLSGHMPGGQARLGGNIFEVNFGEWDVEFGGGRLARGALWNGHSLTANLNASLYREG